MRGGGLAGFDFRTELCVERIRKWTVGCMKMGDLFDNGWSVRKSNGNMTIQKYSALESPKTSNHNPLGSDTVGSIF